MNRKSVAPPYYSLAALCSLGRELPLYTAEQARAIDAAEIQRLGSDGLLLMRRAAEALMAFVVATYPRQRMSIFCGGGNNGGDGWLLALLAHRAGWSVEVLSVAEPGSLSGDARCAYDEARQAGVVYREWSGDAVEEGVVVDALFGSGLNRPIVGHQLRAVRCINRLSLPVLAVDIPSGLCADSGAVLGDAVRADYTMSLVVLKKGLLTGRARAFTGELLLAALGVDEAVSSAPASHYTVMPLPVSLPRRSAVAHKGESGRLVLIGGSANTAGAIIMAAESALLSGAGLITVLTSAATVAPLLARCPEVMPVVVEKVSDEVIERKLASADAVVIGPGLGVDSWARELLSRALRCAAPLVLDADALSLLAEYKELRGVLTEAAILTPHPGEAARLLGTTVAAVESDRYAAVASLRQLYRTRVLLKGAGSLMMARGKVAVCPYGNAGMASGGYGDVLSGVLGALLVQGLAVDTALTIAVNLHAAAADRLESRQGQVGMRPTELSVEIRELINSLVS
ncbi:NAD(P)H-hydrate epimerase [Sinobacterium caligoides]|uniref:Bifunctional NAD(P)H-hydrate repair enzyme n=2 Tax=Sinobacterium caligoides TaxID=933926 RepID=A0A3N2DG35_9GAMM|nr:NAD(P)H-hydrate epimerase [Sinobacterium caligoides]